VSAATGARVALRARSGLEALDLGVAMARAWWRPLAASWAAFVLPVACVAVWLLRDAPVWAIALLWWLRPAFARVPLYVLSQELFGQRATLAATARALPGLLLRSGLFASLVPRRLSPVRTFVQPVLQLEGLRGAARTARARVLLGNDAGVGALLALVLGIVNASFTLGLLLFVSLVTPSEIELDVWGIVFGDDAVPGTFAALYLAGMSLVEPLAVACGFALYVNRRVFLEGWEIELAFRQLATRAEARARMRAFAPAVALLAFWLAAPAAQGGACRPDDPESARDCIAEVLADPAFGGSTKELRWMPKEWQEADESETPDFLVAFAQFVSRAAQLALYGGLTLALVALLFALRGVPIRARPAAPDDLPRAFLGLDLDPRSLPADVVAAAREAWARGGRVAALSLLYRGALVSLSARAALVIPESATELECLRAVRRTQAGPVADAFSALTHAWIGARYAHEPPGDAAFDALCTGFAAFAGGA
jgi:hypothetical protein